MSPHKSIVIAGFLTALTVAGLTVGCLYRKSPVASKEEARPEHSAAINRSKEEGRADMKRLKDVTPDIRDLVKSNNHFALDLYVHLAAEKQGKNLFFSPYSVSSALAMVAEGALSETAEQMGDTLRYPQAAHRKGEDARMLPWEMARIHTSMAALNDHFTSGSRGAPNDPYEMRIANALWGEKTYEFKKSYFDALNKHYHTGGFFPVDFLNDYEGARQRINGWVEKQTHNRIKDMIPKDALDAEAQKLVRLILTNAIYFKGAWAEVFQPAQTKDDDFTLAEGKKRRVPMMRYDEMKTAHYAAFQGSGAFFDTPSHILPGENNPNAVYPDDRGFTLLELLYKGGGLSMVLIVPRSANGLAALEKKMTSDKLQTWIGNLQERAVNVFVPRFKLETNYAMEETLQKMGMVRAFKNPLAGNGAQFEGMSESEDTRRKLYISKVLHKAFVEVNEKGTEAAAATAVISMAATAAPPTLVPFTPTFKADRPFLFLIRDVKTGSILFLGRMMNPKQAE